MDVNHRLMWVVCGVLGSLMLLGCQSTERARVSFSYVVEPESGLPPGMRTLSIMPANVGPNTDPKWSDLCTTVLQSLVNESRTRFGADITISDRRDTQATFDEADLAAAGMSTGRPGAGGKLLAAQGAILSNVNVKVEKHIGKRSTISGFTIADAEGHRYKSRSLDIDTREIETVTRTLTVQTDFKLIDTSNNQVLAQHSSRPYTATHRTRASLLFGSSQTEAELTPQDEIIAGLVNAAAREFISQLLPCRIDVDTRVVSSHNERCIQGVRFLRGELWKEARSSFRSALAANPGDHRAAYGAGVAYEASGRYDDALRYYRRACAGADREKYRTARDRIKLYGNRVRP